MKKISLILSLVLLGSYSAIMAQIGYQVSLLNSATGEPRANETVTCAVSITDAEGGTIYSESQSAISNDFGVLSLSVGNANTFKNADWGKFPFFISVSVNDVLIGKSQILSVPIAEGLAMSKNDFIGAWKYTDGLDGNIINIHADGTATREFYYEDGSSATAGYLWELTKSGLIILTNGTGYAPNGGKILVYSSKHNALVDGNYMYRKQ